MSVAHHSSSYILVTPPKVEELSSPLEKRNFLASQSIYEPLTENEIRLVRLHPGSKKEPIYCSLTMHLQVRAPSYEALSYVWGSQERVVLFGRQNLIALGIPAAFLSPLYFS